MFPEGEGSSAGDGQEQQGESAGDQHQNPGLEAHGDGQGDGQQAPRQQPRTVSLQEHVTQRKKFQAQIRERDERLNQLTTRMERIESGFRGAMGGEQVDPAQQRWKDYAGVTKLEAKVQALEEELKKRGGIDPELEARIARAEQAADLAADAYFTDIEGEARRAYNAKEIGIPLAAWERVVAAEMTPEETMAIVQGNRNVMAQVISRAKGHFRPAGSPPINSQPQRNQNGQFQRRPPVAPGPGGSPPPAPQPEKVTGRKLHDRGFEVFSRAASGAER